MVSIACLTETTGRGKPWPDPSRAPRRRRTTPRQTPSSWSSEFGTETSVAFGTGSARHRIRYESALAGWREYLERYVDSTLDLRLS
jgi:hypothetical protein